MPDPTRLGDSTGDLTDSAAGGSDEHGSRERVEAVVRGRVQGVGFRRYVRGWAQKLALDGWVRNEPDGTVRLIAEGDSAALDRLSRLLWGGSPVAHVDAVEIDRSPADADRQRGAGFEIRR